MKTNERAQQEGSVLLTTFLSITILTLICATSLYITSQNSTGGMLTSSWQQALTAAESGVDSGIRALNASDWSNWRQVGQATLPVTEPSPASSYTAASIPPSSSNYNFLPSNKCTMTMSGEGAISTSAWVTVDTAGMSTGGDPNGQQWYRIRSVGRSFITGPVRVSMNKLDGNLRNTLAMNFSRKENNNAGATVNGTTVLAGPTRTVEAILQPVTTGGWARGISLRGAFNMSGGGTLDSFDSSNSFKSTNGLYDVTKRQSHGDVGTLNSSGSDLKGTYLYGSLAYSGATAVKNTTNVQGTISTPFTATLTDTSSPGWASGFSTWNGAFPLPIAAGNKNHPTLVKVNGDLTMVSGNTITITAPNSGNDNNYVSVWVTGSLATKAGATIAQAAGVKTTWYVGGDITVSAGGYSNSDGLASGVNIVGYGPLGSKVTVSGSGVFVGTVNAPNYSATVSGSGNWSGAMIANTLTISGGASFHYDEALKNVAGSTTVGNYAFASWFEDNSDPARLIAY